MIVELKVPSPGESISEVELSSWLVADGDQVEKDQEVAEIESEKATLPLIAPESGQIRILIQAGETASVNAVACTIDTSVQAKNSAKKESPEPSKKEEKTEEKAETKPAAEPGSARLSSKTAKAETSSEKYKNVKVSPVAREMMADAGLSVEDVINGLRRIGRKEVELARSAGVQEPGPPRGSREVERRKMSQLRKKLSQRLVAVKNETAMLTTFNEVDMSEVIRLRKTYQQAFTEKHGVKLGFMSFFTRAASEALRQFPNVNSMIDGDEIVTHHYSDIGIAVQTEKGLMVPVLRNTESMSLAQLEEAILEIAAKARNNRISMDDMSGGTFSITNGGIFGSMLSTPLINPPQAAILGMHNIVERPVAVQGRVEIRPVMYLALSYDHRIIDGKDSVSFLVRIKELIENPVQMLFPGKSADEALLDL